MVNILKGLKDPVLGLRWLRHAPFRPRTPTVRRSRYRGATFDLLVNEDVGWRIQALKRFEDEEVRALTAHVRPDDLVVDVGANQGVYTVLLAKACPRGRVIAFEPLPSNRGLIARNLELNGITNAETRPEVLSDRPGTVAFSVAADSGFSGLRGTGRKPEETVLQVSATTLDEAFGGKSRAPDVIKIDVEGAELAVLRGGHDLLHDPDRRPRALLVELNATNQAVYDQAPDEVVRLLRQAGYRPLSITRKGLRAGWPVPGGKEDVLFLPDS